MIAQNELTRKQEALLLALMTEKTHAEAAAKAGVSEATMRRWLLLPAFQEAFRRARRAVVECALAKLQDAAGEAVDALRRNLTADRPADQIRAALGILGHSVKAVEVLDLIDRVDELERLMKAGPGDEGPQPDDDGGDP